MFPSNSIARTWSPDTTFHEAIRVAVRALSATRQPPEGTSGQAAEAVQAAQDPAQGTEVLGAGLLEVAVLDRDPLSTRGTVRAFRRIGTVELDRLLSSAEGD